MKTFLNIFIVFFYIYEHDLSGIFFITAESLSYLFREQLYIYYSTIIKLNTVLYLMTLVTINFCRLFVVLSALSPRKTTMCWQNFNLVHYYIFVLRINYPVIPFSVTRHYIACKKKCGQLCNNFIAEAIFKILIHLKTEFEV